VDLKPGNVLVMFTDGVTEAKNPAADEFGYHRLIIRNCFSLKPARDTKVNKEEKLTLTFHRNLQILLGKLPLR